MTRVKIVQRFDKPYAAYLKKIVRIFPAARKPLYYAENQSQVSFYEFISELLVSRMNLFYHFHHFAVFVKRQFGRVHAAYFNLAYHSPYTIPFCFSYVLQRRFAYLPIKTMQAVFVMSGLSPHPSFLISRRSLTMILFSNRDM